MNNETITGSVVNHGQEHVAFDFYTGPAGVRRDRALLSFAYVGDQPRGDVTGKRGTIGDDTVELVQLGRSAMATGMMVGTARVVSE